MAATTQTPDFSRRPQANSDSAPSHGGAVSLPAARREIEARVLGQIDLAYADLVRRRRPFAAKIRRKLRRDQRVLNRLSTLHMIRMINAVDASWDPTIRRAWRRS